jgi:hypothetical protein
MIGLYYPYIHIRNDAWLKMALLYWDRIARIVPDNYHTEDSEAVKRVAGELDAIKNESPRRASREVSHQYAKFITKHRKKLRKRYAIKHIELWKADPHSKAYSGDGADPRLAYIYAPKMAYEVGDALLDSGLADNLQRRDARGGIWMGMHPDLAQVYMTSLAEQIAARSGYQLLADDLVNHVVVGSSKPKRLAELLLADSTEREVVEVDAPMVATIALQTVVPKSLSKMPIKKIIKFRQQHADELGEFQKWMSTLAVQLSTELNELGSRRAMKMHLEDYVQKNVEPRVNKLEKKLNKQGIETTRKVMTSTPAIIIGGILAATGGAPIAVAGMAVGAIPAAMKGEKKADKTTSENPAAYLMHVRDRFGARGAYKRVRTAARKFILSK